MLLEAITCIFFLYACLVLGLYSGWRRMAKAIMPTTHLPVSIIIAFKDERAHLPFLVKTLSSIDYPAEKLEYIFSNDHSDDGSLELLESLKNTLPGNVHIVNNSDIDNGKKAALKTGALKASGDILFFTDADCQNKPGWINSMLAAYEDPRIQMVQGPVQIIENNTAISHFQQIEFLSLMMTAAGSMGCNKELLASGANLSIRRSVYLDSLDKLKSSIHTGDDMFLLEYVKKRFLKGICFVKSQEAIITTPAVNNWNELWNQRKRWSSKAVNYSDWQIILSALLVFITNVSIVVLFILSVWDLRYLYWTAAAFAIKTLVDLPLMLSGINFYPINKGLRWFLLTQLVYPIYVTTVAFAGVFGNFSWKNRNRKGL